MDKDDNRRNYIDSLKSETRTERARSLHAMEQSSALRLEAEEALASQKRDLRRQWEYLTRDDLDDAGLDELGQIGYELVSALSFTTGFGLGGNTSMKVHFRYVFKRKIITRPPSDEMVGLLAQADLLELEGRQAEERLAELSTLLREA